MKKVLFCFTMPRDKYCGGVASIVNSYLDNRSLFLQEGVSVELFDYEMPEFWHKLPQKIQNIAYGFFQCRSLLKQLKEKPVDTVHIHTSRQFLFLKDIWLAKVIKKRRGIRVCVSIHVGAAETVYSRIRRFEKQSIRWINQYVDQVLFLSDALRLEFEDRGMEKSRGVTVRNFHDLSPLAREDRLAADAKLQLLFVGAIHREKGILDLLTALNTIQNRNFHLDICGQITDGTVSEEFETLVSRLGERVSLHGYVRGSEKSALFQRADILLLPSYHEGLPLVVLEAMASGCALIVTPVGALPEFLTEENVLWVSSGDVPGIAEAISKLQAEEYLLNTMKHANEEKGKRFSVDAHIHQLCEIYRKL